MSRFTDEQKYAIKILISMIPIGIVGILMKDWVEAAFNGVHVVPVCRQQRRLQPACLAHAHGDLRLRERYARHSRRFIRPAFAAAGDGAAGQRQQNGQQHT